MRAGWLVHPRNLIVYGVLLGATILTIRLQLTPWVVGTILASILAVYYFVLPAIAMRGLPVFDAEMRRLLVKGDAEKLLELYKARWLLRAFAPPGLMKFRLGQIHAARRIWSVAFQAYHEAMRAVRLKDRYPLVLGYAEAGFHSGEDEEIKRVLPELRKDTRAMGITTFMLVHVLVAGSAKKKTIRRVLDEWEDQALTDADRALHTLALAETLALEGRRARALETLGRIDVDQLPETIRPLATLLEAKIDHVEGRKKKARKLFDAVRRDPAGGRAKLELKEFLEE